MVKNKLILVSPGGLKGFYTFGILTYLKNNYKMNDVKKISSSHLE